MRAIVFLISSWSIDMRSRMSSVGQPLDGICFERKDTLRLCQCYARAREQGKAKQGKMFEPEAKFALSRLTTKGLAHAESKPPSSTLGVGCQHTRKLDLVCDGLAGHRQRWELPQR